MSTSPPETPVRSCAFPPRVRSSRSPCCPKRKSPPSPSAPTGRVYAAAAPGGKVYRLDRMGKPVLHYDSKAQYVWSLAFSGNTLFAGTGLPGEIHKITGRPAGRARARRARSARADAFRGRKGEPLGRDRRARDSSCASTPPAASPRSTTPPRARSRPSPSGTDGRIWIAAGSADAGPGGGEPISAPVTAPGARPARTAASRVDDEGKDKAGGDCDRLGAPPGHPVAAGRSPGGLLLRGGPARRG